MTRLSLIAAEAQRLTGRMPEPRRRALQDALIELCESHWHALRGAQPATPLARELWSVTPPLADLMVDLYAAGDPRLAAILAGLAPERGLALLVLAEIERGDSEAIRIAYEAMMVFDSPSAASIHAERIAAALRHELQRPDVERHFSRQPLPRALAIIAARTGRHDVNAVSAAIRLLAAMPLSPADPPDNELDALDAALHAEGMQFLGLDGGDIRYALHGQERKPVSRNRLCDMLAEIRQLRLA